ncbi:MAG: hypothetical protein P4M02_08850, partial [Clostridia bacterium]|nr:hypothetical protein [Clostridia bacterium]
YQIGTNLRLACGQNHGEGTIVPSLDREMNYSNANQMRGAQRCRRSSARLTIKRTRQNDSAAATTPTLPKTKLSFWSIPRHAKLSACPKHHVSSSLIFTASQSISVLRVAEIGSFHLVGGGGAKTLSPSFVGQRVCSLGLSR